MIVFDSGSTCNSTCNSLATHHDEGVRLTHLLGIISPHGSSKRVRG